jgi:hypothetical protein
MSYTPPPPPPDQGGPGVPPPPPPGGGEPGYGGGPAGPPQQSSKAVGALVIGVVSPVLGLCCAFIGLVGIAAVVLGKSAQREILASNGRLTGLGMAKAGVVLGIIGAAIGVLMTVLNIILLVNGSTTFDYSPTP